MLITRRRGKQDGTHVNIDATKHKHHPRSSGRLWLHRCGEELENTIQARDFKRFTNMNNSEMKGNVNYNTPPSVTQIFCFISWQSNFWPRLQCYSFITVVRNYNHSMNYMYLFFRSEIFLRYNVVNLQCACSCVLESFTKKTNRNETIRWGAPIPLLQGQPRPRHHGGKDDL